MNSSFRSDERFSRIVKMIGAHGLGALEKSFVTVVGLGAVGSYAVEALARSGVGRLRLVDFDEVKPSNINRQLYALESTLGAAKVDVAANRVQDINPKCEIEKMKCFVHQETLDAVLAGRPDVIIDAIDSVNPKIELLAGAQERGLEIFSSMGAAMRSDPSLVRVGPLAGVKNCPLARQIRKKLRQRGAGVDFCCVYSIEPAGVFELEEGNPEEAMSRGRSRRILPSLPTLTGIFGLTIANWTIQYLVNANRDSSKNTA